MPFDPARRIYTPDDESPRRPMLDWLPPPIQIDTKGGGGFNEVASVLGRAVGSQIAGGPDAPDLQLPAQNPSVPEPALPVPDTFDFGTPRDAQPVGQLGQVGQLDASQFRPRRAFPKPY